MGKAMKKGVRFFWFLFMIFVSIFTIFFSIFSSGLGKTLKVENVDSVNEFYENFQGARIYQLNDDKSLVIRPYYESFADDLTEKYGELWNYLGMIHGNCCRTESDESGGYTTTKINGVCTKVYLNDLAKEIGKIQVNCYRDKDSHESMCMEDLFKRSLRVYDNVLREKNINILEDIFINEKRRRNIERGKIECRDKCFIGTLLKNTLDYRSVEVKNVLIEFKATKNKDVAMITALGEDSEIISFFDNKWKTIQNFKTIAYEDDSIIGAFTVCIQDQCAKVGIALFHDGVFRRAFGELFDFLNILHTTGSTYLFDTTLRAWKEGEPAEVIRLEKKRTYINLDTDPRDQRFKIQSGGNNIEINDDRLIGESESGKTTIDVPSDASDVKERIE